MKENYWYLIILLTTLVACGGCGGGSGDSVTEPVTSITVSLSASNNEAEVGSLITLTWSSTNAQTCSATGDWSGSKAVSGNEGVNINKEGSNTFTLNCSASNATSSSASVMVNGVITRIDITNDIFSNRSSDCADYDENYKQGWDPKGTAYGNVNESKVASTKLTKILKENTYLGELPSSKLIKMKWNPVTDIKLKQIYEGKKFKPGDMWSDDFDYKGMMVYGSKVKINVGVKTLRKLYDSAEDVNYHTENSLLWPVIQHLEKGDKKNAEALLKLYNKLAKKTASTIKEGKLNEAYKSDIVKKWDSTKVMMNDLRQFILQASEAGGADLARDVADALKLMSNYAMGEYKKANRK